jgi:DNA gyrase/topoisomerase IV subunit B
MNNQSSHIGADTSAARGPVDTSSLLVRALVAYSVYEHGNEGGTATRVQLELQPRLCILEDNGRGIGLHRAGYVESLLEQLSVRQGNVALHGLGLAIISMSSPSMTIESRRHGTVFQQQFAWGVARGAVQIEPWAGQSGTRITLQIAESAPPIDLEQVIAQVDFWRSSHPGLRIEVACNGAPAL